jgi:Phage tail tube protein
MSGRVGFNGSAITRPNFVLAASFNINSNLRAQKAVGSIGAVGIGNGEFTVTGQLQTYFVDATIYKQVLSNAQIPYDMRLGRADGSRETLLFDFPAIKLSLSSPSVGWQEPGCYVVREGPNWWARLAQEGTSRYSVRSTGTDQRSPVRTICAHRPSEF